MTHSPDRHDHTRDAGLARKVARRALAAAVLAVLAGSLAGLSACSSSPEPGHGPAGNPAAAGHYPWPRPDSVGGLPPVPDAPPPAVSASPDQVAQAALEVMFAWYCDRDSGPAAATRRALASLAPPMSTDVLGAPPVAAPGAQWDLWASHRAMLTPRVTPGNDPTPPDTPTTAYRQYQVTQTVRGADGWVGPDQVTTVFVTLVRTPDGWRISDLIRT